MRRSVFLLLLFLPFLASSQMSDRKLVKILEKGSEKKLIKVSTNLIRYGDYFSANKLVEKLLVLNPGSANYNYRKGLLHLKINNDFKRALPYFKLAVFNTKLKYDEFSAKERCAPIDAIFYIARCYHLDQNIDLAMEYYRKYLGMAKYKSPLFKQTEFYLLQCNNALNILKNPVKTKVENLGPKINTEYSEYAPILNYDLNKLFFNSKRPWVVDSTLKQREFVIKRYNEDVYSTDKESDTIWTEPKRLDFCTEYNDEGVASLNNENRLLYFSSDSINTTDIYYNDYNINGEYFDIRLLSNPNVNTNFYESGIVFTKDGNTGYFVSDRPGGFGGTDIYMVKNENGLWSKPINLGDKINTPYDEDSPSLNFNDEALYFASNGAKSMGGFDIFVSVFKDDGTWGESYNIGAPFNTTSDEMFLSPFPSRDEEKVYICSNRYGGYGKMDIYVTAIDSNFLKQIELFENGNANSTVVASKKDMTMDDILSYMNYIDSKTSDLDTNEMFLIPLLTNSVSAITSNSAKFSGKLISLKGENVMERGFVYSTKPEPTINDSKVVEGFGKVGNYSAYTPFDIEQGNMLKANTTYYVRTYATTDHNVTSYGKEVTFTTLQVGQNGPSGGIVFYDNGTYSNGWRYLEAAPEDQSNGIAWGCEKTSLDSLESNIGFGLLNTLYILKNCNENSAAKLCYNYTVNGIDDWYLPSFDELKLLYVNLHAENIGNFTPDFYWSSTQESSTEAISINFDVGFAGVDNKSYFGYVRAIRKF